MFFISEPWTDIAKFSLNWLNRIGFKLVCVNNRGNLLPNIWCFCIKSISPTILDTNDQQIFVHVDLNGKAFHITTVYASNCHIRRRLLWDSLRSIQHSSSLPWCCLGDFNAILGAHEQRSNFQPIKSHMQDSHAWIDNNNLIHLSTKGTNFTWSNGRRGKFHIQRRLDRAICNHGWITACNLASCTTLTKL